MPQRALKSNFLIIASTADRLSYASADVCFGASRNDGLRQLVIDKLTENLNLV